MTGQVVYDILPVRRKKDRHTYILLVKYQNNYITQKTRGFSAIGRLKGTYGYNSKIRGSALAHKQAQLITMHN